jgi:LysM repeat protein
VVLDGKPAKLNLATGEIKLVKKTTSKKPDSLRKQPIKISDSLNSKSDFHIVKKGETLLDISEMYGISINQLKKANGLETTLVDLGEKLRINNFNQASSENSKTKEKRVHNFNSDYHIVKKDETLFSISKRYALTVAYLKNENGLISNTIKIGQKLKIRNFDLSNNLNSIRIWVVKEGDTLYSIAEKTGTTVSRLKHLNGLKNDIIKIGQKLTLK